jgi:hemolysin III
MRTHETQQAARCDADRRKRMRHQRPLSLAEEIANSLTHGAGLVASLVGLPVLVIAAAGRGDAAQVVGCSVFATSLIALYTASTIYHSLPVSRAKEIFRVLDHAAIYLLIAGTYTPFTLGVLRGAWGWTLFGLVWSLAALGIVSKVLLGFRYPRASALLCVVMGWLAVVAIQPVATRVPAAGLGWLVGGGLLYTGGIAFYAWERQRYSHVVWHLFVLAGSVCHFFAVLWYGAPPAV